MATYIGKRIVPVHCGKWDKSKDYEMLSIVLEEASGDSYISRRVVPAGTAITDTAYWMLHSLYSQQIKDMSDQLSDTEARIKQDNDATAEAIRKDNKETAEAIKQDNANTAEEIKTDNANTAAEIKTDNESTEAAILADNNNMRTTLGNRMASIETRQDSIEARQDANVRASTDANADYAAEVVDARVDGHGTDKESLGASIRGAYTEVGNLADYIASLTYENVQYIDGTLEIQHGIFYNKDGTTKEWPEFDAVKLPVKKGERYCTKSNISMAMYKGTECLGYVPCEKIGNVYHFVITDDLDYIWVPLGVTAYGKQMIIRGSYYPERYIEPGKQYTLLENREFLPLRGYLDNCNLDKLNESGIYLLLSNHSYENMPDGPNAGFLFTLYDNQGDKTGMQLLYTFTTGVTYYRSRLRGTWRTWANNTLQMSEVESRISSAVLSLHQDMRVFGVEDLFHRNLNPVGTECNGVSFSFDADGYLTVTGTAETISFVNVYASKTQIPSWLECGKEYVARINDPTGIVFMEIYLYDADGEVVSPYIMSTSTAATFTIPEDTPGVIIRFCVKAGKTANTCAFPSITEKHTPEEYYDMSLEQGQLDRTQLDRTMRRANQIRTFRQYNFWECEKMENGFKNKSNEWVENEGFDSYFLPITNDDRYYFTRTNTSILVADKDKNILAPSLSAEKRTCTVDGSEEIVTFWCHEIPYLEDAVYLEVISSKATHGYLRSSNQKELQPTFDIGTERGACTPYEALFIGDTLISPDFDAGLGRFEENTIKLTGSGESSSKKGYYTTSTLFIKKGTILDVSCTNLLLNIRGWTTQEILYRQDQTRYEFQEDFVGVVDYHLGSWNWASDDPGLPAEDEHFFIRVITPEDQKNNPWKGKVWYSYGTSISDIGVGDVVGNNGHSGKWPLYLDAVSGMERHNGAIGSGGIQEGTTHGGNVKAALLTTPYDCDLVTLEVLPNDGYVADKLGEITDTDPTTECGAFRQCCEYITKYTRAKFVVLFVTSSTSNRNDSYTPYEPLATLHVNYRNAVSKLSEIAEYYGVAVIDAEKEAINWLHRQKGITLRDHIHPNYLGGEMYGKYIWGKLREMQPYPKFKEIIE